MTSVSPPSVFQSTLPARGATPDAPAPARCPHHFNPRSPHGERPHVHDRRGHPLRFQSTLPARGATPPHPLLPHPQNTFQSTLPARGATVSQLSSAQPMTISIHAPRTGSDDGCCIIGCCAAHFNPRSPHGERQGDDLLRVLLDQFQSTLPARGATLPATSGQPREPFQSTLPARGATWRCPKCRERRSISIHAPRTGSDAPGRMEDPMIYKFQSTLPARGATLTRRNTAPDCSNFNPRSPHGERLLSAGLPGLI